MVFISGLVFRHFRLCKQLEKIEKERDIGRSVSHKPNKSFMYHIKFLIVNKYFS